MFGVCLGLQAIVEADGGALRQLHIPMHGKSSDLKYANSSALFQQIDGRVQIGRYHSICADRENLPAAYRVTAETDDGVIMAIEHAYEPVMAVQFHPESIMSLGGGAGMKMLENAVEWLLAHPSRSVAA